MKKSIFLFALISLVLQSCFVTNSTKLRGYKPLFGKINTVEEKEENIEEKREGFSQNEVIIENKNEEKTSDASNDFASVSNEIILDEAKSKLQLDASCDKITFLNGNEEEVKLLEIGDDYLKYKRCDNLDGPTFSVSKSKVFMIVYSNGNKEVIDHEEEDKTKNEEISAPRYNTQTNYSTAQETNGFAIASFILGILGFIPLAGIILGIVATKQITKNPNRFKGKGFASAGIMLSIFWVFLILALLAL